jgi:DNA-directed RNA polymerase specialized sigma24 family protein
MRTASYDPGRVTIDSESDHASVAQAEPDLGLSAALRAVADSVAAGDVMGMLEALARSTILDGLVRTLSGQWQGFSTDRDAVHAEVDFAVAQAVDTLVDSVRRGRHVANVPSFLRVVAWRRMHDAWQRSLIEHPTDPALLADSAATDEPDALPGDEESRARLFARARALLPRIGESNLQAVMALVLDTTEAREPMTSVDIGDALGLKPATVRQLKRRAFQRFLREAKREQLVASDFEFEPAESPVTDGDDEDEVGVQ